MTTVQFLALVKEAKPALLYICRSYGKTDVQTDDNYQEVLLRLWSYKDKFEVGTNFTGWATTVAKNLMVNEYRSKKNRGRLMEEYQAGFDEETLRVPSPDEVLEAKQESRLLREILNSVTQPHRDVLILFALKEMSYKEIASYLEVPIGTVMSRLARARQQLQINPKSMETSP